MITHISMASAATSQFINTLQKVRKSCFVLTSQKAFTKAYACCPTTQGSIKVCISALLCLRIDRIAKEPERKPKQDGVEKCEAKLQWKVHAVISSLFESTEDVASAAHRLNEPFLTALLQLVAQLADIYL